MKFLVDAQLPRRLAQFLGSAQHHALHTLDLPDGNATSDSELSHICAREQRVLVTKDLDFAYSFLLKREPPLLLLISGGQRQQSSTWKRSSALG